MRFMMLIKANQESEAGVLPSRELVAAMEDAIEWAMRVPDPMGEGKEAEIEIRQVFEATDFPPDIFPPEERAREEALRDELQRKVVLP
jgi:hypothetical protein